MERFKESSVLQKAGMIASVVMVVVFAVLYIISYNRVGVLYKDKFFVKSEENGNTVFSGRIDLKEAVLTVRPDGTLYYRYDGKEYAPYRIVSDPTVIPASSPLSEKRVQQYVEGVCIYQGDDLLFRGGLYRISTVGYILCDTNGELLLSNIDVDKRPNPFDSGHTYDPVMPSVFDIISLVKGPQIVRRCFPTFYILGVIISVYNVLSILFEDELFRLKLGFSVHNPAAAAPSDWELFKRKTSYIAIPVAILVVFTMGLFMTV